MFPKTNPTQTKSWQALQRYFSDRVKEENRPFGTESQAGKFCLEEIEVDFSKHTLGDTGVELLMQLADECRLSEAIEALFTGESINETEGRAVLHTALRDFSATPIVVEGREVQHDIAFERKRLQHFVEEVHGGVRRGSTDKVFTHIVNIGIGGSDLGLQMAYKALYPYRKKGIQLHFVSSIDAEQLVDLAEVLPLEETLFVVVSKTFATRETMTNAEVLKGWCVEKFGENGWQSHFVGVTTDVAKAAAFGLERESVFLFWDWVCGRFSMWSSVGLSLALALDYEHYEALLRGAERADHHFRQTPFRENIPVWMAVLGVGYTNFMNAQTEAILPYSERLKYFHSYVQQIAMESNGKRISRSGTVVDYATAPIVWGDLANNGQHSFFQLLHQGSWLIPADFILIKKYTHGFHEHQLQLKANCYAQIEALHKGRSKEEVLTQLQEREAHTAKDLAVHREFEGGRPSTLVSIESLTPYNLGMLCALYEHKYFVQGVLWNIYSFDQWGVELGKELAKDWEDKLKGNCE